MPLPARLTLAAACLAVAFSTACSDSTGPSAAQQAVLLATHFDSIYTAATALSGGGSNGYSNRAQILTFLEIPAAFGAVPGNVTVTTATGVEHWKGYELEDVTTSGGVPSDTAYILVAYRDADAHTILLAFYGNDGSINDGGVIANDTLSIRASGGSGSTHRTSLGGACATPSSSLSNPALTSTATFGCSRASFSTTTSLVIPSEPNVDPALTSLSFTAQTFNGQRFLEPSSGATVRRARALLELMKSSNRL